ncbi:MAG: UPF0147 family protein [Halobacteriota archaeon]|nr:UPF0147 family protein [Halobacteriota archaeon]
MPDDDKSEIIKQCIGMLDSVIADDSVPRNIRRSAEEVRGILADSTEAPSVKAASVISMLDSISNDPNIPVHTRTIIWGIASQLETVTVGN